jgi:hypothetical protein
MGALPAAWVVGGYCSLVVLSGIPVRPLGQPPVTTATRQVVEFIKSLPSQRVADRAANKSRGNALGSSVPKAVAQSQLPGSPSTLPGAARAPGIPSPPKPQGLSLTSRRRCWEHRQM